MPDPSADKPRPRFKMTQPTSTASARMKHAGTRRLFEYWTDLTGARTGARSLGSNKFYKAQIEQLGPTQFRVTFNYGRVGQSGQFQRQMCSSLGHAQRVMNSKVNKKIAKGYTRLEMRSEADEKAKAQAAGVKLDKPKKKKTN